MKKLFTALAMIIAFTFAGVQAQSISGFAEDAYATQGRSEYRVTTLNPTGPGSITEAAAQSNTVVLFDVGGVIQLDGGLSVSGSNLLIAGFTAPGEYGIIFKGPGGIRVTGDNVAIVGFHMWIDGTRGGIDGVQSDRASNVLIAYGTVLFPTDEVLSTYGGGTTSSITSENITFYNILAVPSNNDNHAYGGMMNSKGVDKVDYIRSVVAFSEDRNFKFGSGTSATQRGNQYNCVTYNWYNRGHYSDGNTGGPQVNLVGNTFKRGPSNGFKAGIWLDGGDIYLSDNAPGDTGGQGWSQRSAPHSDPYQYDMLSAAEAYDELIVQGKVGWKLTPMEQTIVDHIKNGTDQPRGSSGVLGADQFGGFPSVPQSNTTHSYSDLDAYLATFFDEGDPDPDPVNTAPELDPIDDVLATIKPDGSIVFDRQIDLVYSDADGDSLTVDAVSSNQDAVPNSDLTIIDGVELAIESAGQDSALSLVISVIVSDGELSDTEQFNLEYVVEVVDPEPCEDCPVCEECEVCEECPEVEVKVIDIVRSGRYTVIVNGGVISTHNEYKEAVQNAVNAKLIDNDAAVEIQAPVERVEID